MSLGGAEVLHGIDLALPAGRWTAIVGPNGAGKTTLLKALAHLLPYAAAACASLDRDAHGLEPRASGPACWPGWGRTRAARTTCWRTTW